MGQTEKDLMSAVRKAYWLQDTDKGAIRALRNLAAEADALRRLKFENQQLFDTVVDVAGKMTYVEQTYLRGLRELGLTPQGFKDLGFVMEQREENPLDAIRGSVVHLDVVRTSEAEDRDTSNSGS